MPGGGAAEFDKRVAPNQVVHRRRLDVHTGYRVADESLSGRGRCQRTALRVRTFGRGGKSRRGYLAVLDVEYRADEHDLAVKMTPEEVLVALLDASVQVRERKRRDVAGAAREVQRDRVGDGSRAGDLRRRRCTVCPRGELRRHRGDLLAIDRECERHAPDHAVGIAVDIERADVASEPDGGALAGRGQHWIILMLDLAEHDLAGARAERERTQIVAVKAAQAGAQGFIAERHR